MKTLPVANVETTQELGARLTRGHAWLAKRQADLNARPDLGIGSHEEEEYLRQIERWCEMELAWRQMGGQTCPMESKPFACPNESPVSCQWCSRPLPNQGQLV